MDNCGVESLITCAAFQNTLDRRTLAEKSRSRRMTFRKYRRRLAITFSSNSLVSVCCSAMTGALQRLMMMFQERIAAMKPKFHNHMTMDAIMREWPDTIRVVLDHGLLCVGCPIASFHTPADAAKEHHVEETRLVHDLVGAMKG